MDERIVVSLSVSHINGRLEGLKKKLARAIGHEPDIAEIREYVQDLAYAAIDEDIKPRLMTFYVKLLDGKPTGQIEVGRQFWNDSSSVEADEQWVKIEAVDDDELQQKMKVFR